VHTLHIEHPVTDFATWEQAFARFAVRRHEGGVVGERVSRPDGDEHHVVVALDFPSAAQAHAFEQFLRDVVWSTPSNAPALAGSPVTRVLEVVATG
jgi:hypothetical protein